MSAKGPSLNFSKLSDAEYKKLHPVAFALRDAGFVPLPRYWVRGSDMPKLKEISDIHRDEVNAIRRKVHLELGLNQSPDDYGPLPIGIASDVTDDPRFSKDAAWAAYDKRKG